MTDPITAVSSMATKNVLAALAREFGTRSERAVQIQSLGGVDAAKRVRAGEAFDVVVLARDAIEQLLATGHLSAGSRVDLVRSGVAVAVRAGAPRPAIDSEEALRQSVLGAASIGYSSGPSGVALAQLFEAWGIAAELRERIVTPPPGVPVGTLVAAGEVELGFQQLSELRNLPGIQVLGPLPAPVQIFTTFSGAVGAASQQPEAARAFLAFLASPEAAPAKRREGMDPS